MTLARRALIVNADDFGQSSGVNRGVIAAHTRGILTSASLMVRWPAAEEAVRLSRAHPKLGLGLHLDLGEWQCRDGEWRPRYEVVPLDDAAAVAAEVTRQFDAFERLTGRSPAHVDSHQHVHLEEPVRSIVLDEAVRRGMPVRKVRSAARYCGDFYGQTGEGEPLPDRISVDALILLICRLYPGVTELCTHPALDPDVDSTYCDERLQEAAALVDPGVRAVVDELGIELISFADLAATEEQEENHAHRAHLLG